MIYGYQVTLVEFNGNFICLMIFKNNFREFFTIRRQGKMMLFQEVYGNDYFFFLHKHQFYVFYREFSRSSLFLFTNCFCFFCCVHCVL